MAMNPSKAQDVWKDIGKSVQFTVLELKRENQAHEQEVIQEFADRYQAIIRSLRIRNGDGYLKALSVLVMMLGIIYSLMLQSLRN